MLLNTAGLQGSLRWLKPLSASVESIADFGCRSNEPFALLWTLDAAEVTVVEREEDNLKLPENWLEVLRKKEPSCLTGRSITFITADMTKPIPRLPSSHFDLAFCKNVLYQIEMESNLHRAQDAIDEMARVTKPGGWIIAVEPKIGAEPKQVTNDTASRIFGREITIPVRTSDTKDISSLFEATGLLRSELPDTPAWSYCYRKPLSSKDAGK